MFVNDIVLIDKDYFKSSACPSEALEVEKPFWFFR